MLFDLSTITLGLAGITAALAEGVTTTPSSTQKYTLSASIDGATYDLVAKPASWNVNLTFVAHSTGATPLPVTFWPSAEQHKYYMNFTANGTDWNAHAALGMVQSGTGKPITGWMQGSGTPNFEFTTDGTTMSLLALPNPESDSAGAAAFVCKEGGQQNLYFGDSLTSTNTNCQEPSIKITATT